MAYLEEAAAVSRLVGQEKQTIAGLPKSHCCHALEVGAGDEEWAVVRSKSG